MRRRLVSHVIYTIPGKTAEEIDAMTEDEIRESFARGEGQYVVVVDGLFGHTRGAIVHRDESRPLGVRIEEVLAGGDS